MKIQEAPNLIYFSFRTNFPSSFVVSVFSKKKISSNHGLENFKSFTWHFTETYQTHDLGKLSFLIQFIMSSTLSSAILKQQIKSQNFLIS